MHQQCQASYTGQTSQPLKNKFAQHRRASTNSVVFNHQETIGHTFNLDHETRWFERGFGSPLHSIRRGSELNCLTAGTNASIDTGRLDIISILINPQFWFITNLSSHYRRKPFGCKVKYCNIKVSIQLSVLFLKNDLV